MNNERGFMMLSAVFLTLITSIMAMILMNAKVKVQQRNSTAYLTAINLANEQFAMLESLADEGVENLPTDFRGDENDLTSYNGVDESKGHAPIKFTVKTGISGSSTLKTVKITVTWTGNDDGYKFERIIRVNGN